jgi:type I restriction enzyme S subunit
MAVKQGYKQTEVGVIPEDWEVKGFGEICKVNQGLQIAIEERLKVPTVQSKIYITIQYLNSGKTVEYIDDYTTTVCCTEDDVLMTRTGNTGMVVTGVSGVFHNNFFKINTIAKMREKRSFRVR